MVRSSEGDDTAGGAALRASKGRLVTLVARESARRGLRVLAGGGKVLSLHGLISPRVMREVSFIVAPSDLAALVQLMGSDGWVMTPHRRFLAPLPSAITAMTHEEWPCVLWLHSVIPGFFADPEETFDIFWDARSSTQLDGATVQILDKLSTVIFAAHDRLMGDRSRPSIESSLSFFLAQYTRALTDDERTSLLERVRAIGAEQELRPLLEGLGLDPGRAHLPSDDYVMQRLAVESVTSADASLLAALELPVEVRRELLARGQARSIGDVLGDIPLRIQALLRLRSAPKRLDDRWGAYGR
ncbi:MAG: hypothetical protein ACOH1T_08390 [Microbacteriaceae bacterium]